MCLVNISSDTHTLSEGGEISRACLALNIRCLAVIPLTLESTEKKVLVLKKKKRIPAFFSLMFPLFFDSDYAVMLGSFTIKAPAPCVLKKWCRAWQVWNKQHLKRRRTEFKWAEPKAVAEILFMQMKTEGWSFIFYSWAFMAFCLSCQGCVCARLSVCVCAFDSDCHLRPTHTYCTELTPDHSALEKQGKSMPLRAWGASVYGCTHTCYEDVHAGGGG